MSVVVWQQLHTAPLALSVLKLPITSVAAIFKVIKMPFQSLCKFFSLRFIVVVEVVVVVVEFQITPSSIEIFYLSGLLNQHHIM